MTRVLVITVNYRSADLTLNSIRSLAQARTRVPGLTVEVVENDSGDAEQLRSALSSEEFSSWVRLTVASHNGGYAYGNNMALRSALSCDAPPDYFLLLNPDTEVFAQSIENLIAFADSHPRHSIVGPKLINEDGSEWNRAFRFPTVFSELDNGLQLGVVSSLLKNYVITRAMAEQPEQVDWLPGAALLIRREVFERVGLMDEDYFLYYEETDFCLHAARHGYEVWYYPGARVRHLAGKSTGVTSPGAQNRRLPGYWFDSRRRYFLKNFGLMYAASADLAYGLGAAALTFRAALQGRENPHPPHLLRDLAKHFTLLPRNRSRRPLTPHHTVP